MNPSESLLDAFMQRRTDLRRYFAVRVGDAEAEDLVQEIYLKIATHGEQEEIRSPGAYLYRLGSNLMLDRLRHQRSRAARDNAWRQHQTTIAPSGEAVYDAMSAEEALAARDRLRRLCIALEQLPENVQRTFRLHKFEGLSHSEVAAKLGVSRSLVEKHMMRALKHLTARVGR